MHVAVAVTNHEPRILNPESVAARPSGALVSAGVALGFGLLAVALPFGFHGLGLGRAWMPMYVPLLLLAFLVRPALAVAVAAAAPLVSWTLFGMPAQPIALAMAFELSVMVGVASLASRRLPAEAACALGIVSGRVLAVLLLGRNLTTGWQGLLLAMVVVSLVVRLGRRAGRKRA